MAAVLKRSWRTFPSAADPEAVGPGILPDARSFPRSRLYPARLISPSSGAWQPHDSAILHAPWPAGRTHEVCRCAAERALITAGLKSRRESVGAVSERDEHT
jgi:hypothetical protein